MIKSLLSFLKGQVTSSSEGPTDPMKIEIVGTYIADVEAAFFYGLFLFGLVMSITLFYKERRRGWSIRKVVFPLFLIPILFRGIEITMARVGYFSGPLQNQKPYQVLLGSIPNYTYFFSYSLMFSFWIGK